MKKHLNIWIQGRVQGVGFRYFLREKAEKFSVLGFATNESDGSIYAEIEGEGEMVDFFVNSCREGPKDSRVSQVNATEGTFKNFKGFSIK